MSTADNTNDSNHTKSNSKTWEIEILISGGAVFSLYQFSIYLSDLHGQYITSAAINVGIPQFSLGCRILSIYFGTHLSVRAFWLGLILLQKYFPDGINVEKLDYSEPYKSKAK